MDIFCVIMYQFLVNKLVINFQRKKFCTASEGMQGKSLSFIFGTSCAVLYILWLNLYHRFVLIASLSFIFISTFDVMV